MQKSHFFWAINWVGVFCLIGYDKKGLVYGVINLLYSVLHG